MPAWATMLARVGYATKGAVYFLMGALAVMAAAGEGGRAAGSAGLLGKIAQAPRGHAILVVLAFGLAAYASWRLLQAMFELGVEGGVAARVVAALSGVAYGSLALLAARLAVGEDGGRGERGLIAIALAAPLGRLLVGAIGAGVVAYGVSQLVRAARGRLVEAAELDADRTRWLVAVGRAGLAARGVVLGIVGTSLIRAALEERASASRDSGGALREVATQPLGALWLGVVAAGLAAYGLYMLGCALAPRR